MKAKMLKKKEKISLVVILNRYKIIKITKETRKTIAKGMPSLISNVLFG